MKRVLIFLLTMLLPVFLFLEMWSNYQYNQLEDEIVVLEDEQIDWIEKNKQIITGIAVYNSPERIEQIAEEELELVPQDNWDKMEIIVEGED